MTTTNFLTSHSPQNVNALTAARVLIVDDAPEVAALFSTILRREGATVSVVDNGAETLVLHQQARKEGAPLGLIILDWTMPDVCGLEVARLIRATDDQVKIAFLTAYHDLIRPELIAEVDADLWAKPIEIRTLVHNVKHALHQD
jgi:two-component system OmpR family response regulator